jgi:hypothetical protein
MPEHVHLLVYPREPGVVISGFLSDVKEPIAREVWNDDPLAATLEADAIDLRRRFDEAFWIEERGFYALGLDHDKRPIDSLTSNVGHLLWSGVVPPERRETVADLLLGPDLWSGWGVPHGGGRGGIQPLPHTRARSGLTTTRSSPGPRANRPLE